MGIGTLIEMLKKMNMIYATYNIHYNSIDVYTYAGY